MGKNMTRWFINSLKPETLTHNHNDKKFDTNYVIAITFVVCVTTLAVIKYILH
jgi:hypothetical protein